MDFYIVTVWVVQLLFYYINYYRSILVIISVGCYVGNCNEKMQMFNVVQNKCSNLFTASVGVFNVV